ncbi:hypothetical protein ALQ33_00650 [Pseudomonas syringae pv. philadelphi]|uniref:Uncharacterized protein n=1 Tax=Pseudomonas syringae pv. philadelphi TaxID=251706 RepID=A0A3M3ZJ11_9PSED|nr:hypothetical protein ALQ33_00650 [Pseudomonas syringae pv. philadelphi]
MRLVRITPQTGHIGGGQRRQLRAGQAFSLEGQGTRQRIADLSTAGLRAPVLFKIDTARRQPGSIGWIAGGFGLDGQRHVGGFDPHRLARLRAERIGFLPVRAFGRRLYQCRAKHLRRKGQRAALLRVNRVTRFDHAMAHAVDQLFVGPRVAQFFDPRVWHLQRAQAAVVKQRHRMVDAQGQNGLCLNIDAVLIQARFNEDGRLLIARLFGLALHDLQGQWLAFQIAQLQGRNHHAAGCTRQQGDDPARGRLAVAVQGSQAVELTCVAHLETAVQYAHIGLAELGDVVGFQRQFDGFTRVQACAIDTGRQLRSLQ